MDDQDIKALVEARAVEKDGRRKLRCADAFKLNREQNVPLKEISRVCNKTGIQFCQCQLGCFK